MIGPVDHIGIAVRRLEDALATYRVLGLGPESVEDHPALGVRAAFLPAGDVRIELLEPVASDGVIARFLERRGEGLHHVALRVTDLRAELDRLRDAGMRLVDAEPRVGARGRLVAFVHPSSVRGVLLELVQAPP
ncbi:MAG: methylmalonyl-CoA epimerase [Methanobacteriota archaeon]